MIEIPKAINSVDMYRSYSAAHLAIRAGNMEMLEFLHKQDYADFNMVNRLKKTPIYSAIEKKSLEMVKFLVEKCDVNIDHRDTQLRTPLFYAASKGSVDLIKYLLSKGADINAQSNSGRTVLLKLIWHGQHSAVQELLEDPSIHIDIKMKDSQGKSALHVACWGWGQFSGRERKNKIHTASNDLENTDNPNIVKLLIQRGLQVDERDAQGSTPLMTACATGAAKCIPILVEAGANINY